jgi:hypothetical protein
MSQHRRRQKRKREKIMTYRTFDIDSDAETGSAIPAFETSNPARHSRSRRHSALMSRRTGSTRIAGFGF